LSNPLSAKPAYRRDLADSGERIVNYLVTITGNPTQVTTVPPGSRLILKDITSRANGWTGQHSSLDVLSDDIMIAAIPSQASNPITGDHRFDTHFSADILIEGGKILSISGGNGAIVFIAGVLE
jgi:hypothetical protein